MATDDNSLSPGWGEGLQRRERSSIEYPEAEVLRVLQRAGSIKGWLLYLGEPGAGKTTLLESWFSRISETLSEPTLGMTVPVFVRFSALQDDDYALDSESLADLLWDIGTDEGAFTGKVPQRIYAKNAGRLYTPIWLLDGLDEVPPNYLDDALFSKLANLYGCVNLTCRIAVYETLRRSADRYKSQEYELVGLKPGREQLHFLTLSMAGNEEKAAKLYDAIQSNDQLRLLASNPMLLTFMADVSDRVELSATRVTFYEEALNEMWHRKLSGNSEILYLMQERDVALKALSHRMSLDHVEAPLNWFLSAVKNAAPDDHAQLREGVKKAGILRLDERRGRFQFRHLTFQEYYLAQVWENGEFGNLLEQYWSDPRYEGCLALVIELLYGSGRVDEITQAFDRLIQWADQTHARDPTVLWSRNRSPSRTLFHLVQRAGIPLSELHQLFGLLVSVLAKGGSRLINAVQDPKTPVDILAELANADSVPIRLALAGNPGTPSRVLTKLAGEQNPQIVRAVAANTSTPSGVLVELASMDDPEVRHGLAFNSSTPTALLQEFAEDSSLQGPLAFNPNTPVSTLKRIAEEVNQRLDFDEHSTDPLDAITRLAQVVQELAAVFALTNSSLDRAFLEQTFTAPMARGMYEKPRESQKEILRPWEHLADGDWARKAAAKDTRTPSELLQELASDEELDVRIEVAKNQATPTKALALLSKDKEGAVRLEAFKNPTVLFEDI